MLIVGPEKSVYLLRSSKVSSLSSILKGIVEVTTGRVFNWKHIDEPVFRCFWQFADHGTYRDPPLPESSTNVSPQQTMSLGDWMLCQAKVLQFAHFYRIDGMEAVAQGELNRSMRFVNKEYEVIYTLLKFCWKEGGDYGEEAHQRLKYQVALAVAPKIVDICNEEDFKDFEKILEENPDCRNYLVEGITNNHRVSEEECDALYALQSSPDVMEIE